ncbi:MAG: type II toxin-antitoxin system VapC family toxin [Acidobacteria bacterium]|nr:type II toxin-antitoxin system VapC family toxin [Acidobacteriota bacterium]
MILDTNALSAIAEGEPGATKKFTRASPVAIPVIVLGEFRFGIAHSRHQPQYEKWLEDMISACRVLDVTEETASWYSRICSQLKQAGTPIPSNDAWIAALCRQHSLPLLSQDRHFDSVTGIERLAW